MKKCQENIKNEKHWAVKNSGRFAKEITTGFELNWLRGWG